MAHLQEEHLSQILSCPQDVAFNLQAPGMGKHDAVDVYTQWTSKPVLHQLPQKSLYLTPVSQPETSQVQLCLIQTSSHSHHSDAAPLSHSAMSPYGLLQSTFYMLLG